ncbi:hypothetical protein [Microvirga roseola]|uniref:hypothetical protein n=1 Tax=Microvirga roseola TaxID=2883126 RepID=UPI001E4D0A83|nr:hypothetical protein [Microvirga roseola]
MFDVSPKKRAYTARGASLGASSIQTVRPGSMNSPTGWFEHIESPAELVKIAKRHDASKGYRSDLKQCLNDNMHFSIAVLQEVIELVDDLRTASPNSALAAAAEAKIGCHLLFAERSGTLGG